MKVGTDAMILGAYVGERAKIGRAESGNSAESGRAGGATYRILDIGTGTGVLSLMLAQRFSPISAVQQSKEDLKANYPGPALLSLGRGAGGEAIDAIDIDESAYLQAKENFENSSWRSRIHVFHTSIQDFNSANNLKYDLIISNPPYFEYNQKASKESERYNERTNARSFDKLSFSDLVLHVARLLDKDGMFYVIIPAASAVSFISEAEKNNMFLFDRLNILSKQNQEPVRTILGFAKNKMDLKESLFIIYQDNGAHTDEYIELTKNYHARHMRKRGT